jgi:hypothetical protein
MLAIPVGPASGYSTQAQISLDIAALINDNRIHLWFASEFNPIRNHDASNPLLIFRDLDIVGKTGEHSDKSRNLEANLYLWLERFEKLGRIGRDVRAAATYTITQALASGDFRPFLFRLHGLDAERKPEPDEYQAKNVSLDSPNLWQLIPDRPGT